MSRSLRINLCLKHFGIAIYENFDWYCFYLFRLFFVCKLYKTGLKIMYCILEISRYTNIVYIGVYLVLTYI